MKLIDTHAHVNFRAFKEDAKEVIKRANEQGVGVINVGSQLSTSTRAVKMANEYENVWAAIGLHPLHLKEQKIEYRDSAELEPVEIKTLGEKFEYEKYLELAKNKKVVAIGEVGLDYHHFEVGDDVERLIAEQKETLILAIKLANEVEKPIMIHCWDGYEDLLELLTEHPVEKNGIIHSFIGSHKTAKKFLEMGYLIGMNGIVTYSESYDKLIRETPLEKIVVETDCPYLAPGEKKGQRNEPIFVREVVEKIAKVKNITYEEVAKQTTSNACSLLKL